MIEYLSDRGVVPLTDVITHESVTRVIADVRHARCDCFFNGIVLAISSPGGNILAYERLVEVIDGLRNDGVPVETAASGHVASAAAFLLSMGDDRRATPGCRLTYHLCRIEEGGPFTADSAIGTAAVLDQMDARIVTRLAERGVEAAHGHRACADPEAFADGDWEAIFKMLLLLSEWRSAGLKDKGEALKLLRESLDRCRSDAKLLATHYRALFALDRPISPVLARELFLLDEIDSIRESMPRSSGPALVVPEWEALWPGGRVATQYLRRHSLILGETGSGKTASGVMPLVRAMLAPDSGVGCALVVDPKRELLPAIRDLTGDVRIIEASGPGRPRSRLNLMAAPHWVLKADLEAGLIHDAARKILMRSATLTTQATARTWAGLSPTNNHGAYWEQEGGNLARLAISLALTVIERRSVIFAGADSPSSVLSAPRHVRDALRDFAEAAGIAVPRRDLQSALDRTLDDVMRARADASKVEAERASETRDTGGTGFRSEFRLPPEYAAKADPDRASDFQRDARQLGFDWPAERETPNRDDRDSEPPLRNAEWHAIRTAVRSTEAYRSDPGFRRRFDDLDADLRRSPQRSTPQEASERILLCAFSALDDAEVRPAPNVMALARRALELFLKPEPDNGGSDESNQGADNGSGHTSAPRNEKKYMLPASYLANALKPLYGAEADPIWREVSNWETLARYGDEASPHYTSILAHAQQALGEFAESAPAWTLYFGVEPYWNRVVVDQSADIVDFTEAVGADEGRTVWVIQPKLGGDRQALVAKAVKAAFFEAVLGNEDRASGVKKPLVGYVADEFHRFVTAGEEHGEQSYLDTCRSFGGFCALASQSVASIEHALAGAGGDHDQNAAAVSILLNNVGTKLFFRTTDDGTIGRIRSLCPTNPGRPMVVDVRPPSTLAPGECYAALPDGRFERRQLAPWLPGRPVSQTPGGPRPQPPQPREAHGRPMAKVIPLFKPRREG